MAATYTTTTTNGNTQTQITYTCTKKAFAYTIIGDDIKADFDFLTAGGEIQQLLDQFLAKIQEAGNISDAFNFDDAYTDISHLYSELQTDVNTLKASLDDLHSALMTDIDNVNAELKLNFGYWVGGNVNEASRTVI